MPVSTIIGFCSTTFLYIIVQYFDKNLCLGILNYVPPWAPDVSQGTVGTCSRKSRPLWSPTQIWVEKTDMTTGIQEKENKSKNNATWEIVQQIQENEHMKVLVINLVHQNKFLAHYRSMLWTQKSAKIPMVLSKKETKSWLPRNIGPPTIQWSRQWIKSLLDTSKWLPNDHFPVIAITDSMMFWQQELKKKSWISVIATGQWIKVWYP